MRRTTVILWGLGLILLVLNVWLYLDFWKSSAEIRGQLTELNDEIRAEQEGLEELDRELATLELDDQNLQVAYLNRLIDYRTFPWSSLFDRLTDVLPNDVRLTNVRPDVRLAEDVRAEIRRRSQSNDRRRAARNRSRSRSALANLAEIVDEVDLQVTGVAKNDESLLQFIDALYADPGFLQPVLVSEQRDPATKMIGFNLAMIYRTRIDDAGDGFDEEEGVDIAENEGSEDSEDRNDLGDDGAADEELADADERDEEAQRLAALTDEDEDEEPATVQGVPVAREEPVTSNTRRIQPQARESNTNRPSRRTDTSRAVPQRPSSRTSATPQTGRALPRGTPPRSTSPRNTAPRNTAPRNTAPQAAPGTPVMPRTTVPRGTPQGNRVIPRPRRPQTPPGFQQPLNVRPDASSSPRLRGDLRWPAWWKFDLFDRDETEALS